MGRDNVCSILGTYQYRYLVNIYKINEFLPIVASFWTVKVSSSLCSGKRSWALQSRAHEKVGVTPFLLFLFSFLNHTVSLLCRDQTIGTLANWLRGIRTHGNNRNTPARNRFITVHLTVGHMIPPDWAELCLLPPTFYCILSRAGSSPNDFCKWCIKDSHCW